METVTGPSRGGKPRIRGVNCGFQEPQGTGDFIMEEYQDRVGLKPEMGLISTNAGNVGRRGAQRWGNTNT